MPIPQFENDTADSLKIKLRAGRPYPPLRREPQATHDGQDRKVGLDIPSPTAHNQFRSSWPATAP